MKWKVTIIVCCYIVGAGFLAAWKIEADKRLFNLNPIMWMMKTGCVFLFVGTTVFTHLVTQPIGRFLFSSVHKNVRGIIYWFIFGTIMGVGSAIALSKVWGVLGGTLFGVFTGVIIVTIGYLESKSSDITS